MTEARNLRNMTMAQTPLLGEENTPLHADSSGGTGFGGATPVHRTAFTPNPLATPYRAGADSDVGATPRDGSIASSTPLRTPLRDSLAINPDGFGGVSDTPRGRGSSGKHALRAGFQSLPKPENNFELLVPEDEEDGQDGDSTLGPEMDAADRDARLRKLQELEEQRILARRSQPVKLGLPRPSNVDPTALFERLELAGADDVERLINAEVVQLLLHDSVAHPLPGTLKPGSTRSSYVIPDDADVDSAKEAIHAELASLVGFPNAHPDQLRDGLLTLANADGFSDESSAWATVRKQLTLDASTREWVDPATLTAEQRAEGYNVQMSEIRELMSKDAMKAAKAEKKLGVQLGGYQTRFAALSKRVTEAFAELQVVQIDYESFSRLKISEDAAGPRRVSALKEEVEFLAKRENGLQERYKELEREKRDAEARIAALEDRVMAEAEAQNEAALAAMEA